MAATLSLPKLPNLRPLRRHPQIQSKLLISTCKSEYPPPNPKDSHTVSVRKIDVLHHLKSASLPLTALTFPFLLAPEDAFAVGGEFGILEGRSFALVHPIVMSGLFVYTLYAGYLGWQWRRVRTIQEEINQLKKQLKPVAVTPDGSPPPQPPSPLEAQIQQLTEERKELIKGSYRDKHFNAGSILLGFGVFESVFGGINTWFRTGKLFPGPHLFAGAAITILWAAAAALVPPMQKGSETARNLHIALNAVNVLLFIWQIPTGIDIVFKVFEFTKWP
ncbi:plant/protein [Perilla frutescens var. hirtella]|uniref:Plant/protein n=1 Tax=Perilla frutescens var. hirtella TaxID=608512 RepID=A0AAD4NVP2_PERFH|nr:plant/protein [Perilla frutescens var. hirtella]